MADTQQTHQDPLDVDAVLQILIRTLPQPPAGEETTLSSAGSQLGSGQDALAALFHAIMLAVGFRFVGLGEEGRVGDVPSEDQDAVQPLPREWNAIDPQAYAFRYKHSQSSLTFLIKSMRMANKFLVHGMAIEDSKTCTLELVTADYTSRSFFPYTAGDSAEPLVNGFISASRVKDLISLYKISILQKLIPGLNKPGYEETAHVTAMRTQRPPPRSSLEVDPDDPLRIPTRQPARVRPPMFDDPYGHDEPFANPYAVGQEDLDPLGLGRPRFGGGFGAIPPLRGPSSGGGMHVGFDHPMFGRGGRLPGAGGIYGGPETLPRGSVPPGARFDHIVPPAGAPGQRYPRADRQSLSGEPDFDEAPPPGYNDMFM